MRAHEVRAPFAHGRAARLHTRRAPDESTRHRPGLFFCPRHAQRNRRFTQIKASDQSATYDGLRRDPA